MILTNKQSTFKKVNINMNLNVFHFGTLQFLEFILVLEKLSRVSD